MKNYKNVSFTTSSYRENSQKLFFISGTITIKKNIKSLTKTKFGNK